MAQNIKFPESKWIYNWGVDKSNANNLYSFILDKKPEIIIETGTFEAQATYVMAKAANENNNNCYIYTIDYNGDPTSNLDISKWVLLEKLRNENLEKIKNEFKNVKVIFCEGDSRDILKKLFINNKIKKVDIFYQDSMHFFEGIKSEWELVYPYIKKNCYTIFDDVQLKGVSKFKKWFKNKYKNSFSYEDINDGHKQFIVKKI